MNWQSTAQRIVFGFAFAFAGCSKSSTPRPVGPTPAPRPVGPTPAPRPVDSAPGPQVLEQATVVGDTVGKAQVLVVDEERIKRESSAHKSFDRQTSKLREQMVKLRRFTERGGTAEQSLANLDSRKRTIGNDAYEQEKSAIARRYSDALSSKSRLEYTLDQLRSEAMIQVERAKQPLIRAILKDYEGQIIIRKRCVLGLRAGSDVTTELINRLDEVLPEVTLTSSTANSETPTRDSK
jgi:hypothetical protein